jgi:uncharacterized cupredoxin-like copper-binding protein
VLVEALSTGHKVGLGVVGALFIFFALASAFLFPRVRSSFPGRGLPAFIVVTVVFFFGMLTAVEVFGAEAKEKEAEPAGESTSESTTTATQPTTSAATTTTVELPAATTTTAKPKPAPAAAPQTIPVTETEFKITLQKQPTGPGPVTFDVKNAGAIGHDFVITGNGVTTGTPLLDSGKSAKLKVTLKPGTYDVFCSVPGHKGAGMDLKLTIGS